MDGRRRELRLTWDEVAAHAGIHRETLRQIRTGSGNIRPLSATGIEGALHWAPGSIDAIISGGEPTPTDDKPEEGEPTVAELAAQVAALTEKVERILGEIDNPGKAG